MPNRDKIDELEFAELSEDELFLDDMDFDGDDYDEYDEYDDYDDYDEFDDEYDEYDDYDDFDDEYDEFDDELEEGEADDGSAKKSSSIGATIVKSLLGVGILGLLGFGGYWVYSNFAGSSKQPAETLEQPTTETQATVEEVGSEEMVQTDDTGSNVEFKYAISHAGDASDKLNQMNADFRTATSLFTQNNDLNGYKEALNNIESQRQLALAELANHEENNLSIIVMKQYEEFFNALNTAFGAQSTDQAVEVFNTWNTMQNEFNQEYTQTLTSMLDQAGIEWSQTETENGLTIVY